jgi:transposase
LATDALGNALRFILTSGERNDITQAEQLVENFSADHVIADKGYDSEAFVLQLRAQNSEAVIPSRSSNKVQREIDRHLYRERYID